MPRHISGRRGRIIGVIFFSIITFGGVELAFGQASFFEKSLHHTGAGMRNAYQRKDGLMGITKVPYDKLDCKKCHVKTCDTCHAVQKDNKSIYSTAKAKEMDTCLTCHGKQGLSFKLGKQMGKPDVHVAAGMVCVDCHKGEDVHGDGNVYTSMRAPGIVKASCTACHKVNTKIKAHVVHKEKLHCTSCHVSNSVSCMNCHFDSFLKTGKREGNFFFMQSWLLLMNHDGKVFSGTAMSFVANNKKHIVYSPQFTHAVQKKGRACADCHGNEATKLIQQGKSVPMMAFKKGKMETWKGVVPTIHEKLQWAYLNKKGNAWVPLKTKAPAKVQWWYAKPLTEGQLKKLSRLQK